MKRPVGGFLPLRLPAGTPPVISLLAEWVGPDTQHWMLHNGRSALHALWQADKPRRIWLPAYVCSEVASSVPASGDLRYFPLDNALQPRIDFLSANVQEGDHILAVDYFGRPANPEFVALVHARPDVGWVEDRAHALDPGEPSWGDWVLYSPRKLVGVPDGGILVAARKPLPPLTTTPLSDFSFALPAFERFEDRGEERNEQWYASYQREERAMKVGNQVMSRMALDVLNSVDVKDDSTRRRRNYEVLRNRLAEWSFFAEPGIGFAPLGFPIRVKNAAMLAKGLSERHIFAARHWATLPSDPRTFAAEHRLANELLTLPIDYRYGEPDMHRVADAVIAVIAGA